MHHCFFPLLTPSPVFSIRCFGKYYCKQSQTALFVWMGRTPCWSNFWQGISVFKKKKTHIQGEIFKQENRCSCTILYLLYVTVHSFGFFLCSTRKVRQNYISKLSHCKHSLICLQTPESIQQEYLPTQAKIQLSQSLLQQPPLKTANRKL